MSLATKSFSIFKRDAFLFATKIITSVIIARKLGPEMLGILVILTMIPSYAEAFGRIKFDVAAVFFLGKNKYSIEEVVLTLNGLALATSALMVAVIVWQFDWLYGLLFSKSDFDATQLVYFILLQIPLHFLWMNYSYLIIHKEDIATYNWMIIIQAFVSSFLAIALLLLTDLGLWAVVGTSMLGTLLSLIYGAHKLGPTGRSAKILNRPLIHDLFQYGSKLYLGGLIGSFQAYISNLIVVLFLVPAQVAVYSLARGLGQMIDRVPAALNTILYPRLTKIIVPEEAARLSARAFRLLLVLLIGIGVIAAALIHPVVNILYGAEFLLLVTPFLILIPGIVLAGATTPFMQYFMSINRPGLGITLPILPLVVQFALALSLVPRVGPEGAALALSVGLILFALIRTWMFLRLSACTIRGNLMVHREDLRYLYNFSTEQVRQVKKTLMVKQSKKTAC